MNSLKISKIKIHHHLCLVYVYIPYEALFKMLDSIGISMTTDH